ncbi:hypothetical protein ACROYT_G037559 [Oculina patagonica]
MEEKTNSPREGDTAQLQFEEKLDSLKKVLPFVSEVQLASLLTLEGGNMNAVVQRIFHSSTGEEDAEQADKRVIDLTVDETLSSDAVATHDLRDVLKLTQVPVDTNMLKNILVTVEDNEAASASHNLLSFQKPDKSEISVSSSCILAEENNNSRQLSEVAPATHQSCECPYCFRKVVQNSPFCNFCGGIFEKTYFRW